MTETAVPRRKWAWAVFWGVYLLLLSSAISGISAEGGKRRYLEEQALLKQSVSAKQVAALTGAGSGFATGGLEERVPKLREVAPTDPLAAKLYAAYQTEIGEPVDPKALAGLVKSKDATDRAFAQAYLAKKPTEKQARDWAGALPDAPFVNRLAKVHALERAGLPGDRAAIAPLWRVLVQAAVVIGALVAALLGCGLWAVFFYLRRSGGMAPLGHPTEPLSDGMADLLALRSGLLLAGFLVLSEVIGAMGRPLPPAIRGAFAVAVMLTFIVLLFRSDYGARIRLADVGLRRENLGKHILWGLAAVVANVPLLLMAAGAAVLVRQFVPEPHHPVQDALMANPTAWVLFGVWLQAGVLAPFWEEVMFRGCLFPALSKALRGPLAGALLSSLLFAALHPQGLALWLALGTIGAVSCLLTYQTRSLVPSVVMHSVHNTLILFLGLLMA